MTNPQPMVRHVMHAIVVEGDSVFTLADLCRACGLDSTQIMALVDQGVLDPSGSAPGDWVFAGPALRTALAAQRLMRDLELDAAGVALALDLIAEIATLRMQLVRGLAR
jgi:chaperone modulatory protein CbpM